MAVMCAWVFLAAALPSLGNTLRLFVLTGQSNSLGTPTTNTEAIMVLPRVGAGMAEQATNVPFFYDNTADGTTAGDAELGDSGGAWTNVCLQKGGYYAYSADHWGPEVGFARLLWDAGYRDFGIVKASRGGGGNSYWDKTNTDHHIYDKVVNTVSNAVLVLPSGYSNAQVVCLLYVQGESNNSTEASQADIRFSMLMTNLQHDLSNAAGMKAVFGQIASDTSGNRLTTTQKQFALAAARSDIGFAQSTGLTVHNVDGLNVHYNGDSLIVLGERMASEAMLIGALPELPLPAQGSLYAWFRGDHGVVPTTNSTVARWDNLASGATNGDLTQIIGLPALTNGAFLGTTQRAFVRFDGASQAAWSTVANFGSLTNARTLVFALRVNGAGDGFLFDGSTASGMTRAQIRTNTWQVGLQPAPIANAANPDTATAPRVTGTWQIHEFSFTRTNSGTQVRHWISGTNVADCLDVDTNGLSGFILAANVQAQRFLAVDIGEVMIFTNELSSADRSNVVAFLRSTWTEPAAGPDPSTVYAWYRGDDGLAVSGGVAVTRWTNFGTQVISGVTQSGRDLSQLTGAPQKTYLRRADGSPAGAVTFNGWDGIWAAKASFGIISTDRTVLAVARLRDDQPQGFLFDATSYSPGLTRAQVKTGYWHVGTSGSVSSSYGSALGTPTSPSVTNLWQVHTFIVTTNRGAPEFMHFVDGSLAGDVALATNGSLSGLMIGANVSQQYGIRADVAEFLVFNSALSGSARSNVEAYLSRKWSGVTDDTNAPPPSSLPPFIPVFTGGADGYTCFRIPALVTTTNGTVIAVSDGRIGSCGDIPTPLDLVCKRSFDNGKTWGPLQIIADYGSNPSDVDTYPYYSQTNISRVSAGDAALLLDRTNGRVWVLYDNGGVVSGSRKIKLEMRYSDDDGATWSPAIDIEAQNPGLRPTAPEFLAGPGNGIQLTGGPHAGRLIFCAYAYRNPYFSTVIYSDDHGATWQRGGNAGTGGGEIQVAETVDGGLIASMRDNSFSWSGVRTFSLSADGGATWRAVYTNTGNPPSIPDPGCQGNIYRLTTSNDSNASRLIQANSASSSSRVNMTLRISYDEGATWPASNQVYAAGSAYSSVTKLATGDIGLLFEKDPYGNLAYTWRSVSQMSAGADSLPPYTVWAAGQFSPAQLMNSAISGPDADPDGDGLTNYQEFLAGTDPLSAASSLRLKVTPSRTNAPTLQFNAVSNKSYTVQHRPDPASGAWSRYADVPALSSNALIEVPAVLTNDSDFFRVTTPQLP